MYPSHTLPDSLSMRFGVLLSMLFGALVSNTTHVVRKGHARVTKRPRIEAQATLVDGHTSGRVDQLSKDDRMVP